MANPTPAFSFPQTHSEIEIETEIEIEIETKNQRLPPATATTIDSSSASTSSSSNYGYDVFISHRGPDTKKNLASHLYTRLHSHGITTFLDQTELKEGLNFSDQIVSAIRSASVQVAMFSENFAESQWCLDELLLMQESGAPILPIFYGVKPAELRWTDQNKSGVYAKALQQLEGKTTFNPQTQQMEPRYGSATVRKWRTVLRTVSDLHGFDFEEGPFNHDEGQMLNKVIQRVEEIMAKKTRLYVAKHPTGLDDKVKDLETRVLRGKAQVVGIVGPGGMGKTTLAKEFFNRKRSRYNKSYFLSDVRESARSLHSLQSKLLYGLTQLEQHIDDIHQGTEKVKNVLSSFQVLLILDDIDHIDQVDALLPEMDSLCSDSLILITSRNIDVLTRAGVEESFIYKLKGLTPQHSQKLFSLYAFRKPYPLPGFYELVDKFLIKCDGLPLALKVFGAHLFRQKETFWEKTLSQLEVPIEIKQKLKISYDALDENEQQIFLDIACFLIGEKRDIAIVIWDEHRFQNLESRCLVEVDSDKIRMHDQLRDMGQEIALERGLWHPAKDIDDLAKQSSVITKLRGTRMFPWYQREYQESWEMSLRDRLYNTFCPSRAMKLQFLSSGGYLLGRILRRLHCPNLIWLSWRDCPYSYLPSWIPMKNLRVLKVQGNVFQTLWQGRSQAPIQLQALEIVCSDLLEISKSIGQLKHLKHMQLRKCRSLKRLPESFGNLTNLQHMEMYWCQSLERLPESFGNLRNLQHMDLSWCKSLERLPESFGNLTNLQHIKLSGCRRLRRLPESFSNLRNLQHMELYHCDSLARLPESFRNLTNLQHMELFWCPSLERLPESFGNLTNLQHMKLSGCRRLRRLPESFSNLRNLQHIKLSSCESLERLPESFSNLTNLQHMELDGCESLERLPESFSNLTNLQHIKLSSCWSLERLPESFSNLTNLQRVELFYCWSWGRLPESFGNLTNLQHMKLFECMSLGRLPESFGNLTNLQHVELSRCGSLERLPESFSNLTNLQHIKLSSCFSLERLPESFGNLTNLVHMELDGCGSLERLPESFGNLTNLVHIDLSQCQSLKKIIPNLAQLRKLEVLNVKGCRALEELDGVEHCISLRNFDASNCPNLKLGEEVVNKVRKMTFWKFG